MQKDTNRRFKICLISSIPVTLWSFYRCLPKKLREAGFDLEICSSPKEELGYFAREFHINVHPAEISRRITPWQDVMTILKLVRLFRREGYDIVHAHTPKAGLLGMIAAVLAAVKCRIYTCHGLPLETESGLKRRLLAWSEWVSCKLAHRVLVVSHSLADKLKDYGICSDKKAVVLADGSACGVSLGRFTLTPDLVSKSRAIRKNHNIDGDDIVIGFIGRLVPDKGVDILLESFSRLSLRYPNIKLLVIGDIEPHRGRLSDEAVETLHEHPNVVHVAFTREIAPYYAAMDLLVLPTKREGFPYTLLEAAALGLPVVATKVTGCIDAVVDDQTGLLVPPGDTTALINAIERLINSVQLRQRLGAAALKRAERQFSSERLLDAHLQLYREMLDLQRCQ